MNEKEVNRKAKYNKKAYKSISMKIKPSLSREILELQEDLGLSKPKLLRKLIDVYKEKIMIVKNNYPKGEDVMRNKKLLKQMQTTEGIWVLGRNIVTEKALGKLITDDLRFQAYKILKRGEYFLFYNISSGIPHMQGYKDVNVYFEEEGSKLTVKTDGKPEFSSIYIGDSPKEEKQYLQEFLEDWDLTEEDIKKYSKTFEKENLEEVNIVSIPSKEDKRKTTEKAKKHPLIKTMESEDGVWFKEKNLIAEAIFEDKTDEKLPPRAVNIKKVGEEIITSFFGEEIIERKYYEPDIVFEIDGEDILMIRKEKHYDEKITVNKEEEKDLENLPTLSIL